MQNRFEKVDQRHRVPTLVLHSGCCASTLVDVRHWRVRVDSLRQRHRVVRHRFRGHFLFALTPVLRCRTPMEGPGDETTQMSQHVQSSSLRCGGQVVMNVFASSTENDVNALVMQINGLLSLQEIRLSEKLDHLTDLHRRMERTLSSWVSASRRHCGDTNLSDLQCGVETNDSEEAKELETHDLNQYLLPNKGDCTPEPVSLVAEKRALEAPTETEIPFIASISDASIASTLPSLSKVVRRSSVNTAHRLALAMTRTSDPRSSLGSQPLRDDAVNLSWKRVLGSAEFELVVQAMVILNVVSMTVSGCLGLQEAEESVYVEVSECVFMVCFTVELLLKCVVFGRQLFEDRDWLLNVLDVVVVLCGWAHLSLTLANAWSVNVTFARVVRVIRTSTGTWPSEKGNSSTHINRHSYTHTKHAHAPTYNRNCHDMFARTYTKT